jgi:NAD(P)-dependent dehydrogenase (short-subunit alcohol dehydrogenase family)
VDVGLTGLCGIVTGGGRGLGAAVAARLVAEGVQVTVLDLTREEQLDGTTFVAADVTDEAQVDAAVRSVLTDAARLDVLVNCAGILGPFGSLGEFSVESWRRTLEVNLTGTFIVCRAVAPRMVGSGGGSIVNFASGSGVEHPPARAAYNVSKAGVISLTKTMANDYHAQGLRVNAVCPGRVNTQMTRDYEEGAPARGEAQSDPDEFWERDEVLDTIVFLASAAGRHLNGQFVRMTGKFDPGVYQ